MKNLLALALIAVSTAACAGPDDLLLSQRNSTDTGNIQRIPPHPTTNWGALSYDNVNLSLSWLTFGSGLTINSGILDVAAPTSGQITSALGYTPVDQAGARSAISLTTTGSGAATYNSGTGVLSVPTPATASRSFSTPSRTLNTCFQISSTRDALFSYAIDVTTTVTLGGTPEGAVFARSYTNSGCSTGQVDIISGSNGQPTTLAVVVGQSIKGSINLSGMSQAGTWLRLETSAVSGSPTFAIRAAQQEVQF